MLAAQQDVWTIGDTRRYFLAQGMDPLVVAKIPLETLHYWLNEGKSPEQIWAIANNVRSRRES